MPPRSRRSLRSAFFCTSCRSHCTTCSSPSRRRGNRSGGRRSLAVGERESIPVGEELSLARSYLDVERIRFGRRLAVEESVEPSGEACLVPPLLLQRSEEHTSELQS